MSQKGLPARGFALLIKLAKRLHQQLRCRRSGSPSADARLGPACPVVRHHRSGTASRRRFDPTGCLSERSDPGFSAGRAGRPIGSVLLGASLKRLQSSWSSMSFPATGWPSPWPLSALTWIFAACHNTEVTEDLAAQLHPLLGNPGLIVAFWRIEESSCLRPRCNPNDQAKGSPSGGRCHLKLLLAQGGQRLLDRPPTVARIPLCIGSAQIAIARPAQLGFTSVTLAARFAGGQEMSHPRRPSSLRWREIGPQKRPGPCGFQLSGRTTSVNLGDHRHDQHRQGLFFEELETSPSAAESTDAIRPKHGATPRPSLRGGQIHPLARLQQRQLTSCAQLQMSAAAAVASLLLCPRMDIHQFPSAAWPCCSASEFPPIPEPERPLGDTYIANGRAALVSANRSRGVLRPRATRSRPCDCRAENGAGELEPTWLMKATGPSCAANALNAKLGAVIATGGHRGQRWWGLIDEESEAPERLLAGGDVQAADSAPGQPLAQAKGATLRHSQLNRRSTARALPNSPARQKSTAT